MGLTYLDGLRGSVSQKDIAVVGTDATVSTCDVVRYMSSYHLNASVLTVRSYSDEQRTNTDWSPRIMGTMPFICSASEHLNTRPPKSVTPFRPLKYLNHVDTGGNTDTGGKIPRGFPGASDPSHRLIQAQTYITPVWSDLSGVRQQNGRRRTIWLPFIPDESIIFRKGVFGESNCRKWVLGCRIRYSLITYPFLSRIKWNQRQHSQGEE